MSSISGIQQAQITPAVAAHPQALPSTFKWMAVGAVAQGAILTSATIEQNPYLWGAATLATLPSEWNADKIALPCLKNHWTRFFVYPAYSVTTAIGAVGFPLHAWSTATTVYACGKELIRQAHEAHHGYVRATANCALLTGVAGLSLYSLYQRTLAELWIIKNHVDFRDDYSFQYFLSENFPLNDREIFEGKDNYYTSGDAKLVQDLCSMRSDECQSLLNDPSWLIKDVANSPCNNQCSRAVADTALKSFENCPFNEPASLKDAIALLKHIQKIRDDSPTSKGRFVANEAMRALDGMFNNFHNKCTENSTARNAPLPNYDWASMYELDRIMHSSLKPENLNHAKIILSATGETISSDQLKKYQIAYHPDKCKENYCADAYNRIEIAWETLNNPKQVSQEDLSTTPLCIARTRFADAGSSEA